MFIGQYERENRLMFTLSQNLESAGFAGIFIPVQMHMNSLNKQPVKGFAARIASSLFRTARISRRF
jgi:hypothetical protein